MTTTAVVKGGGADIWGNTLTLIRDKSAFRKQIARILNLPSMRKDRQLINVLLGAVAGTTATSTLKRRAASQTENGGIAAMETINLVNRASTAGDDTDLTTNLLTYASRPTTYPTDKATRP